MSGVDFLHESYDLSALLVRPDLLPPLLPSSNLNRTQTAFLLPHTDISMLLSMHTYLESELRDLAFNCESPLALNHVRRHFLPEQRGKGEGAFWTSFCLLYRVT